MKGRLGGAGIKLGEMGGRRETRGAGPRAGLLEGWGQND